MIPVQAFTLGNKLGTWVSTRPGLPAVANPIALQLAWASAVALLMSTEFLFQPFVWRNFELTDIALAWLSIARDRLVVAGAIAAMLALVHESGVTRRLNGRMRLIPYGLAVVAGAAAGEAVLSWLSPQEDRQDVVSLGGRVLRWTMVGGAIAVMAHVWRAGAAFAAAAQESRIEETRSRRLAASSQLELLRRHIEPHFLFNTLATVRRLQETDPNRGEEMLVRLFHYLSATLGHSPTTKRTLGEEIDLVLAYLDVCACRMTGRLVVKTEIEPRLLALKFPPLILATLAENAIKHGVFPRDGGLITISATSCEDRVEIAVADDGVGFSDKVAGAGMGLSNIVERLKLLYGDKARLELRAQTPHGVCAVVHITGLRRDQKAGLDVRVA